MNGMIPVPALHPAASPGRRRRPRGRRRWRSPSCSRRSPTSTPSYTVPEGVPLGRPNLIVWADEPNPVYFYD